MKTIALVDLLGLGYFPKELPPCFTTRGFAETVTSDGRFKSAVRAELWSERKRRYKKSAELCSFQLARPGSVRRKLSAPNPVFQFELADQIASYRGKIASVIDLSKLSQSKPAVDSNGLRALVPLKRSSDLVAVRARLRASRRFVLKADVSEFYRSIYTHSIPWCDVGKTEAKRNRSDLSILGNRLDLRIRTAQDGQTKGVPVGPDTSLVIAEMILSRCDQSLQDYDVAGLRYFDDYELYFSTRAAAERMLSTIQMVLGEYELTLNPIKTTIEETPVSLEEPWIIDLRHIDFEERSAARERSSILLLFERALELVRKVPRQHVLAYAIARIRGLTVDHDNWSLLESLLLQAALVEPGTLPRVLQIILQHSELGYEIDRGLIQATLSQLILDHAPVGNSSEVVWALWGAAALQIELGGNVSEGLSRMDDSFVAVQAIGVEEHGGLARKLDRTIWEQHMSPMDLFGQHWLLSYESDVRGFAPTVQSGYTNEDPVFGLLRDQGVCFYDSVFEFPETQGPAEDWYADTAEDMEEDTDGLTEVF